VPLDPNYPPERIAAILADAKAPIVLTQNSLANQLASTNARIVRLDDTTDQITRESTEKPVVAVKPQNLAYVLFTSGSTGRPKGVAIEHRSAATFVQWAQTVFSPQELSGVLFSTSVCFDLSIFEMFAPLSVGGKIILTENALYLPSTEARDEVTLINTVPSAIAELVRSKSVPGSVKTINLAGEALPLSLVNEIYASTSATKVYNLYGPTEDTTYSTYTLTAPNTRVTIGKPLPNSQAYILDSKMNPVPIGVPGELYLAGAGLARGYFGRLDLTAERFIPNPFGSSKNPRMYKTGDLCRWLPDGQIEYLGRLDHQIKLRGFRIELGEIEAVLAEHPGVRQCLVTAREDSPGLKRLVAYLVPKTQLPSSDELAAHLKQRLPEFMIPSAFVTLAAMPLTPNGKVDRKALPAPEYEERGERTAPRNPTEEVVAGVWAEVLHVKSVSVEDNFFELGGHSLLATQVISRLRQAFQIELPLRAVFEAPTVAGLAALIAGTKQTLQAPPLRRTSRSERLPLSFAQQRLWFLNQLEPNNPLYNVPMAIGMSGKLDFDALVRALNEIVSRHEVLRTTFGISGNQPIQVIAPRQHVEVPIITLEHLSADEQQSEVKRLAIEGAREIFDLETGPLFRAKLLRLREDEHALLLNMHHIVSDGWSMWQFIREIAPLYAAFIDGKPSPLPELQIQYADFAVWQREWMSGDVLDQHLAYWTKQLQGAPGVFELPSDRVRPAVQTYRGSTLTRKFPLELLQRLRTLSQSEGATLFMTLLAAYQTLLFRYTGQEDMVVGSPIAGRNRTEIESLIGFFVNAIVLRTDLSGSPTFRELLQRVRTVALDAYAHQELPFEKLVETLQPDRDLTRTPIFQVWFVLQNAPRADFKLQGVDLRSLDVHNGTSKFDLGLFVVEKPDGLHCMVEYSTDLFDANTIERFLTHYRVLLEAIAENPNRSIAEFPILDESERQQVVVEWNRTQVDYPRDRSLHQLIEEQVEKRPDAPALIFESQQLTYRELNARANQLAHRLRKHGVRPDTLVGVCAERSVEMVVALLGTMKAGGAYMPLDPDHPRERLAMVLEDASPAVLLTQEKLLEVLPSQTAPVICLDRDWNDIANEPMSNPVCVTSGKDQAYAIFTSGSTGRPKGVPNVHEGIVNRLLWMQHAYGLDSSDRVLQKTPYSFDVSVWEFFWPLLTGACLVVAKPEGHKDPNYLIDVIARNHITTMHFVPSMLRVFLESDGV
ncbi:MAG TPA: amino acid adenylation domain-containing protein, partial [Terriglobales bacterium]